MSARPGRITAVVAVGLGRGSERADGLREDAGYFAAITQVREALHGRADVPSRGVETR